jgi:8-oxo-dGTP pyrophosphatase MutT (NUDIX family)
MKRPDYDGAHSGQISFPGGKVETDDENLEQTALRETSEELGILKNKIQILGKLSPLKIQVSGFEVNPFVGFINEKPFWKPDPDEVAYLIEAPVTELLNPSISKIENWKLHNTNVDVPFYKIENEKIWGATAMILSEFIEIIHKTKIC